MVRRRKGRDWIYSFPNSQLNIAAQFVSLQDIITDNEVSETAGLTVLRTIVDIAFQPRNDWLGSQAFPGPIISWGIGVLDAAHAAPGAVALGGRIDLLLEERMEGMDVMIYKQFVATLPNVSTPESFDFPYYHHADSKVKRRLGDEDRLVLYVQNNQTVVAGDQGLNFWFHARTLVSVT